MIYHSCPPEIGEGGKMNCFLNQQPTSSIKVNFALTLDGRPRDTNLRANTIEVISRQLNLSEAESEKLEKELKPYDLGHIQAISQGGSNHPDNLFFELKQENRSGGLKNELENSNRLMMISKKRVENLCEFEYDNRIPRIAPVNAKITQVVKFCDGTIYRSKDYTLDNSAYYSTITLPLMRKRIVSSDLNNSTREIGVNYCVAFTTLSAVTKSSDFKQFSRNVASAGKVVLPLVVKAGVKTTLNYLQTSSSVSSETRKTIAKINISKEFNTALSVSSKLLSLRILESEIQKNKTA